MGLGAALGGYKLSCFVCMAYAGLSDVLLRGTGDQASHLLWRLQHGDTFVRHPPSVAVVMIGTNDLGASACLGGQSAMRVLRTAPQHGAQLSPVQSCRARLQM